MSDDKKPKHWVKVLKRVLGVAILLALIGLGLYYTNEFKNYEPKGMSSSPDWGISKDSPIRNLR